MSALVSIEFFNANSTIKKIEFGRNAKDKMVANPFQKQIIIQCTEVVVVAGQEIENSKPFILRVDNTSRINVFNQHGEAIMVDDPMNPGQQVQKTIGEFELWLKVFFESAPGFGLQQAISDGIKRRVNEIHGPVFSPAPQPLSFIQTV